MELETRTLNIWFGASFIVTMTKDEWAEVDRLKNSSVELEAVK
jgi:hypothetical protein